MGDSIVFVCTGNICRSPAAELMFRARMNPLSDVHVSIFGTHGVVGSGMEDRCSRAVRELGLDPGRHVARRLDAHSLDGVGLALCATVEQRAFILQRAPLMLRRVFTLREFCRLAEDVDVAASFPEDGYPPSPEEFRARVLLVADRRGRSAVVEPGDDDIQDPLGLGIDQARRCIADISILIDSSLHVLGLSARATGLE